MARFVLAVAIQLLLLAAFVAATVLVLPDLTAPWRS